VNISGILQVNKISFNIVTADKHFYATALHLNIFCPTSHRLTDSNRPAYSPFVPKTYTFPQNDAYFRSILVSNLKSVEPDTLTKLLQVLC